MNDPLPPYRLKAERAKRHIRELSEEFEAFKARGPYTIYTEDDPEAGQRVWKVRFDECVPTEWSAIIGDAIHNARASLDLLMVAIVQHCDPTRLSYNHVKFIVGETKEKFEARLRDAIKGASPLARRLVEELKPYKGGNEALWRLHQLDILDKHKAIIPVLSRHRSVMITNDSSKMFPDMFPDGDGPVFNLELRNIDEPLEDGAELFRAPADFTEMPGHDEPKFAFDITFGKAEILAGEPVVPALLRMCDLVEGVFEIFERNVLSK